MPRAIKIAIVVAGIVIVLPIAAIGLLFVGMSHFSQDLSVVARREISVPDGGTLIIDGDRHGRSEHGFSQRAGYRSPGSPDVEWFGDVSDGVQPQVYQTGSLVVVIDLPAAQLNVRTQSKNWKNLALIFPDDLGPFPISF